jgi:hypothetical protein
MSKIPPELIGEIDALLSLRGRPYLRPADGKLEPTDCFQWTTGKGGLEIISSASPELRAAIAEAQSSMTHGQFALLDPMKQIRKHISTNAPRLLQEYDQLIAGLEEADRRMLNPSGIEPPPTPDVVRRAAERIAQRINSEMKASQFDLDAYEKRAAELWQMEPDEVRIAQKHLQEEFVKYQRSLEEAQSIKKNRLADVRSFLEGKPYVAYGDVVVAPIEDQFGILLIEGTNAANYGLQTHGIIEALRSIDEDFGVDILNAGFDFVTFRLVRIPEGEDAKELFKHLRAVCPDLEQDADSLSDGIVNLWWD